MSYFARFCERAEKQLDAWRVIHAAQSRTENRNALKKIHQGNQEKQYVVSMKRLTPEQREKIVGIISHGGSYHDAGRAVGKSVATIKCVCLKEGVRSIFAAGRGLTKLERETKGIK